MVNEDEQGGRQQADPNEISKWTQRIYAKEGNVTLPPHGHVLPRWVIAVGGTAFGLCVAGAVVSGIVFSWPIKYMQPISAIYTVPFIVFVGYTHKSEGSPFMILWPALYALHAILIVAGAPIVFAGKWTGLNMLVPIAGYGLLAGLLGHAYSRFALRRLRKAARAGLDTEDGAGEEGQP